MITIENERLRAGFALHGAELISLYDKEKNREVIWQADPKFWARHAPVLFPFVGKVNGGEYRVNGQTYTMGQHGFARDMDFQLAAQTEDSVSFTLESSAETLQKYPYEFRLTIQYTLAGNVLTVAWKIQNLRNEKMYYSIGAHPAFQVDSAQKQQYRVQFNANSGQKELRYIYIDPKTAGADWENVQTLALDADQAVLAEDSLFERDALIFDDAQIEKASILDPSGNAIVTVDCKGFPSFGLWSPAPGAGFICLEPWCGRVDNNGFTGDLSEKYEEQCLEAAGEKNITYTITVE